MIRQLGYFSIGLVLTFSLLLYFSPDVHAAQVQVAWNQDSVSVAGYYLYWGTSTGIYTNYSNVGNVTTATLQNLSSTAYYIAVTAYDSLGNQSGFSPELVIYPLASSAGPGGSISPGGNFFQAQGANQTFAITPAYGYQVSDVTVDGKSIGPVATYTLTGISSPHSIAATFVKSPSFAIKASAGSNGSISPSGSDMEFYGASQTYTITPATGYEVADVWIDGHAVGPVTSWTFSDVTANHTISASFTLETFIIKATAGPHGSISPSTSVKVDYGASKTFTITPAAGYRIADVTVDGNSVGPVKSYTFSKVTADHTISSTFRTPNRPLADAGPNQTVYAEAEVTLDASNSIDTGAAGGIGIASYEWTQLNGMKVHLSNINAGTNPQTTFTAPDSMEGALTFQLTVTNLDGVQSSATCIVNVVESDSPPNAYAGPDQTVSPLTTVKLNGSGSLDPNGSIRSYVWQQIDGPAVKLNQPNPASPQAAFEAPQVGTGTASLSFMLTVTNNYGLKSTDICFVNVARAGAPPNAVIPPQSQTADVDVTVTLDGSGSTSADGIESFRWHQVSGVPVTILPDPLLPITTFTAIDAGQYVFRLTVEGDNGMRSRATEIIPVQ